MFQKIVSLPLIVLCLLVSAHAQAKTDYSLSPDDVILIWVRDSPEISEKQFRLDSTGYINLPLVGRISASGLTTAELEAELVKSLSAYIREPQVTVNVATAKPLSALVLGSVRTPGTHPFRPPTTLLEMIAAAGGTATEAGNIVRLTRKLSCGPIGVASAKTDPSGEVSTAELDLKKVTDSDPEQNVTICADDVIVIPRVEMVYIIGDVPKQGGVQVSDNNSVSVLQALTQMGGIQRTANPQNAKILRPIRGGPKQAELPINVKAILEGKAPDVFLRPNDILFIPGSTSKQSALRALNAIISAGTSAVTYTGIRVLIR